MKVMIPAAITFALALSCPAQADVVLINTFEVPPDQREAVVSAWENARDFLSAQPGYIETALHSAITPNARFELVNIARWESLEAFMDATQAMHASGVFEPPQGTIANPALYSVIRTD